MAKVPRKPQKAPDRAILVLAIQNELEALKFEQQLIKDLLKDLTRSLGSLRESFQKVTERLQSIK